MAKFSLVITPKGGGKQRTHVAVADTLADAIAAVQLQNPGANIRKAQ